MQAKTPKPNRILFIGSKLLGLRVLKTMHDLSPGTLLGVLTVDDRSDSRNVFDAIEAFCRQTELPHHVATTRHQADEVIAHVRPDLCIVVGWYWLISPQTLDSVPLGFVGIHNSMLPRYRGGSPLVWQMINGEPLAGFSLFTFTSGMDDGPIWAQGSVRIDANDYIGDVLVKLEREAVHAFAAQYPKILTGDAHPLPQSVGDDSYCAQRHPEDGNIDWHASAGAVYNFIRAQSDPYPGAFTFLDGRKVTVWRAAVFDRPYFGSPGQIARITPAGVHVVCGTNSAITLHEVGVSGVRAPATNFIKSVKSRLSGFPKAELSIVDSQIK